MGALEIGVDSETAAAIGEALRPREQPEGRWAFNSAVSKIDFIGEFL